MPLQAQEIESLSPAALQQKFGASNITLPRTETTAQEAFDALLRQIGQPMERTSSLGRDLKITPQIENKPFWKAVFELQKATGLGLFRGGSSSRGPFRYSLVYARRVGGLEQETGPFLAVLKGATRTKTQISRVDFDQPTGKEAPRQAANAGGSDEVKLNGEIFLDPKIPLVSGTPQLEIIEAKDENGAAFLPAGSLMRGGDYTVPFTITKPLNDGAPLPRKIASLKVGYRAFVVMDPQTLSWDDANAAVGQKKAGARGAEAETYQVMEAVLRAGAYVVKLRADRLTDGVEDRDVMDTLFQNVKLVDGAGKEWPGNAGPIGARSGVSNPAKVRAFEATVGFGRGETLTGPFKLVWTVPGAFAPVNATFEWKDVPLPTP